MLKFGNKEFRNLQEQVEKNMKDILFILQEEGVLNEFGIKVVGQESSTEGLPSVADYKEDNPDWAYGDAYAIGTQAPYYLYVLTRANGTHPNDYWFNIGEFPMPGSKGDPGPQGETGPQGPQGDDGVSGEDAGFGLIQATAQTLAAGSSATVSVTESGPNTAKNLSFTFGIPRGMPGEGATPQWGNIVGTLADQTDLQNALDGKQATLVSGTNIKTINSTSLLGSGNIDINSAVWGNISGTLSDQTDLKNALDAKQAVIDSSNKLSASLVDGLATVATSGSYNDLLNLPTIPAAQIQSDYTQADTSAVDYIKNKPDLSVYALSANLAAVATSGSYVDLQNKPTIGNGTLTLTRNSVQIGTFSSNQTSNDTINIVVPTKVSDLSNDTGFITGITSSMVTTALGYTPYDSANPSNYQSGTQVSTSINTAISNQPSETWTFTLADTTTTTRTVVLE